LGSQSRSYASIAAVFLSPLVLSGIRDSSGFWKHGHTYQAHPLSCAASLAVQKVIEEENLLENCRTQGIYLAKLLKERLSNSIAAPYVFDVRGGGLLWAVEWDFTEEFAGSAAAQVDFKGQQFAMLVQARCMVNELVIMGMVGGANIENTQGDTSIFAPAYNVTPAQVEEIVERFVRSAEEALKAASV
jgi:E3 ubiquitin-protein ligase TRIP12